MSGGFGPGKIARQRRRCWQIWIWVPLDGERRIDTACEYGYMDRSAVTRILKRPERFARNEPEIQRRLRLWRQSIRSRRQVSRVDPVPPELNILNYSAKTVARSRKLARQFLPGNGAGRDAAHKLDSVAGGYVYNFAGYRSPVQQYIGSLWRTRVNEIQPGKIHLLLPEFSE
jgi:hypothetical protein